MQKEKNFGVFTTDTELKILSWNHWLESITGLSEEKVKGEIIDELFPDIAVRGFSSKYHSVLADGHVEMLSASLHKYLIKCTPLYPSKTLQEMRQSVTISPLNDGSKIIGTITVIKDVTEELEFSKNNYENETAVDSEKQLDHKELIEELGKSDWKKRQGVMERISKSKNNFIGDIISKIKEDHNNLNILSSALQVLVKSPNEIADALIELLNCNDVDLRIYAAQTMCERNTPQIIEALISVLDDPNENVVYHAIESLGKLKAYQATDKILSIALKGDFFTSFPAIEALKNIGEPNVAQKLLPLLSNDIFKTPVIEILGSLGDEKSIDILVELFNNDSSVASAVCKSIYEIFNKYELAFDEGGYIIDLVRTKINKAGINNVVNAVLNANEENLKSISKILGWLEGEEIENALALLLQNDSVRNLVIEALVQLGKKATKILSEQLSSPDEKMRSAIIAALGRIGDNDSVPDLINHLNDEESVAVLALGALAKIGDRRGFKPILDLLGHENPSIRRSAISALNSIGHPNMSQQVSFLLNSNNSFVRESALKIAGYFGFSSCLEQVIRCTSDNEEIVRAAALENLPFYGDPRVLRILSFAIKYETVKCRCAAAKALSFTDFKITYDLLFNALKDSDPWVRIYALRSTVYHKYHDAIETIFEMAEYDKSIPVKIASLEALGDFGGTSAVAVLSKYIDSSNFDIASAAIKALGKINHPNAFHPLLDLLKSISVNKKIESLRALSKRDEPGSAAAIQWLAAVDKNNDVRSAAIETLKELGSPESIQALIGLTADKELREEAIRALSKQNPQKLYLIAKGLIHQNLTVRTAVIEALSRMKNQSATEIIFACLDDAAPSVRLSAIQALERLGNHSQDKKLSYMSENDNDSTIRNAAKEFLNSSLQKK